MTWTDRCVRNLLTQRSRLREWHDADSPVDDVVAQYDRLIDADWSEFVLLLSRRTFPAVADIGCGMGGLGARLAAHYRCPLYPIDGGRGLSARRVMNYGSETDFRNYNEMADTLSYCRRRGVTAHHGDPPRGSLVCSFYAAGWHFPTHVYDHIFELADEVIIDSRDGSDVDDTMALLGLDDVFCVRLNGDKGKRMMYRRTNRP